MNGGASGTSKVIENGDLIELHLGSTFFFRGAREAG